MPISPLLHVSMLLAGASLTAVLCLVGRAALRSGKLDSMSNSLGLAILALWLVYNVYYFLPAQFDWAVSLPLHVCDLLGVVASLALSTRSTFFRALLFFCALPLAGQALATPTGNQDPAALRFWLYWAVHVTIIAASLFDVVVRGFVPTVRDLARVIAADVAYVLVLTPVDILFGWNYGYVGDHKPDVVTAIDLLGPWPQRIGVLLLVAVSVQAFLLVVWRVVAPRVRRRRVEGVL